jgi:pimeloyl-ACP methyl ester carboxylesterase/DNA-binding CsgD family transcriptional regulator
MDAPPVQYVTTSDGYRIAYTVCGEGEPLVFTPFAFSHAQHNWVQGSYLPFRRAWLEALSARFRLIQYDERGQGMSQRGLGPDHTWDDVLLDLEAVVNCLGLTDFLILGAAGGAHKAVRYSLRHPGRVRALILDTCSVAMSAWAFGLFGDLPRQNWDYFLQTQLAPGLTPEVAAAGIQAIRDTVTKDDWLISFGQWSKSDISDELPNVRTPTLVLHARNAVLLPVEESMKVAALIPGAQHVLIAGNTTLGDTATGLAAIERFLAQVPARVPSDRASVGLSQREAEVLRLLAAGRSNQQIADELVISVNTVIRHVANIFDKTGAANRTQAAAYAKDRGLA